MSNHTLGESIALTLLLAGGLAAISVAAASILLSLLVWALVGTLPALKLLIVGLVATSVWLAAYHLVVPEQP